MARTLWHDNRELYRAVILAPDGAVTSVYGPYDTKHWASRMASTELARYGRREQGYTARVEVTGVSWGEWSAEAPRGPETAAQPLYTFTPWPKTPRLLRDVTVTEKIDGTNAAVAVVRVGDIANDDIAGAKVIGTANGWLAVFAQSRKRLITPEADNAGFARWVWANAAEIVEALGEGLHFGEWWGSKIGRKYGYASGERFFSLFNTDKHADTDAAIGGVRVRPVPVLYRGPMNTAVIHHELSKLRQGGSVAAPGFANPEGVCVFHHASRQVFKATLDANDAGKWESGE